MRGSVIRRSILRSNVTYRALNAWKKFTSFLVRDKCWARACRNCVRDHRVSSNNRRVSSRDCVRVPFYWAVFHRVGIRNRARVTIRRAGQLQAVNPRGAMCFNLSIVDRCLRVPAIGRGPTRSATCISAWSRSLRNEEEHPSRKRSNRFSQVPCYVLLENV